MKKIIIGIISVLFISCLVLLIVNVVKNEDNKGVDSESKYYDEISDSETGSGNNTESGTDTESNSDADSESDSGEGGQQQDSGTWSPVIPLT